MPKGLIFQFGKQQVSFQMTKIDRSKLYGFKESEVLDENDKQCELVTLAEDGRTVIGKGGTGIGYMTADREWTDKSRLTPFDLDGEPITPIASSFSAPIELKQKVSLEEFLDHNIRLVYKLEATAGAEKLFEQLKTGLIYKFDYSFRGGLEPDAGFLMLNDLDDICFLVGDSTFIEFIGLRQVVVPPESETGGDDLMDFGMI